MVAVVLFGVTGQAMAKDYSKELGPWNGLGYLEQTASEANVRIVIVESLDWGTIKPRDNVVLLYPRTTIPTPNVLRFVSDGGDLIVADDHGSSSDLLSAMDIRRVSPDLSKQQAFFDGRRAFPILKPKGEHFLFYNVDSLTANHPMALIGQADSILAFEDGTSLVMEGRRGAGRALFLADPSILLNDMLRRVYGNKQFAANMLRIYCDEEPCVVTLVAPNAEHTGTYRSRNKPLERMAELFDDAGTFINDVLVDFGKALRDAPGPSVLVWLLFAGCISGALIQRGRGRLPPSGHSESVEGPASPHSLQIQGLAGAHMEADFGDYARNLVAEVDAACSSAGPRGLERLEKDAELRALLLRFRSESASLKEPVPPVIGAERFIRLYHDTQTILHSLSRVSSTP